MDEQADHGEAEAGEGHVAHDGREFLQTNREVVRPVNMYIVSLNKCLVPCFFSKNRKKRFKYFNEVKSMQSLKYDLEN